MLSPLEQNVLIAVFVLTSIASLVLLVKLLRGSNSVAEKFVGAALLVVPFVGPLLFWFIHEESTPQSPFVPRGGERGAATQSWIAMKPFLDRLIQERRTQQQHEDKRD